MTTRYAAHGLIVDSDVPLPLPDVEPGETGEPDIRIRRGPDRPVDPAAPADVSLALLDDDVHGVYYAFVRREDTVVLRYPGLCEWRGDGLLQDIEVNLVPGADPGLLSVLGAGAVLAVHLTLNGHAVLHASAVRVDDRALAVVGAAGMGKSTLATLFCAAGHDLVSDDILRVERCADDTIRAHPAAFETRLREKAQELGERIPGAVPQRTADGRASVRPVAYLGKPLVLDACIVPFPSPDTEDVVVRRLGSGRAARRLLQFPRIVGWTESTALDRQFDAIADIVERVPVYEAVVPWGPPFRDDLCLRILNGMRAASLGPR